jgi:ankyrin repeat protein
MVKALVEEFGTDMESRESHWRNTPLMTACNGGHLAVADFLLSQRASTHALRRQEDKNEDLTVLAQAGIRGHLHMVQRLVDHDPWILAPGDDIAETIDLLIRT